MLLRSVQFTSLLSFRDTRLDLRPLNVIIGPNASGKSNLVAAIGLLRAAPGSLQEAIHRGGGIREWISKCANAVMRADIECELELEQWPGLRYKLAVGERSLRFFVEEEILSGPGGETLSGTAGIFFKRSPGSAQLYDPADRAGPGIFPLSDSTSFFAQYKDPRMLPPITRVGEGFESIRIYSEFDAGPMSRLRTGVRVDTPKGFLQEDGANLALVLQDLEFRGHAERLNDRLRSSGNKPKACERVWWARSRRST
jgi:predicted ATPase